MSQRTPHAETGVRSIARGLWRRLIHAPVCMVLAVLGVATIAWQLSPAGEWLRHWVRTGGGTAHIGGASNVARGLVMLVDPGSIGAWRFVAALGCCHVVATGLTLGFASLIASQWPRWSDALVNGWSNGAIPALLGVAMAASGGVNHLWRVRTRWIGLAITLTLGFYDASTFAAMTLGSMVAGLVIGAFWWRGAERFDLWPRFRERRVLVSLVIACASLGPLLAAWSTRAAGPLEEIAGYVRTGQFESREAHAICRLASSHACTLAHLHQNLGWPVLLMSVLPAVIMLVLCLGLVRARRSAWFCALLVEAAMAATTVTATVVRAKAELAWRQTHASTGFIFFVRMVMAFLPAAIPVGVVVLLLLTVRLFPVRLPRRVAVGQLVRYVALFGVATIVYVVVGMLLAAQWSPQASVVALLHDVVTRVFGLEVLLSLGSTLSPASTATQSLAYLTGPLVMFVALVLMARNMQVDPRELAGADAKRLRGLITRYGGGIFAWMTQWTGVRHWYDPALEGVVGYRLAHGVAVTLGEPIGQDPMATALSFARRSDEGGLTYCFYSVGADFARQARGFGWRALQIAEESRIELGEVAFKGKRFQDLRTAMNRAKREDISIVWTRLAQCSPERRREIREVVEGWQRQQTLPPLGFTLCGFAEMEDPEVRCELAVDESGHVHGVASWLPLYRDEKVIGWLLDVMRRHEGATGVFHSTIELLISKAILQFQDEGFEVVSLSGSPLAMEPRDQPPVTDAVSGTLYQGLGSVSGLLERYYGFTSLHHFKAKFGPEFHPLYLVYQDPTDLPKIGRALTTAYVTTEPTVRISRIIKYFRGRRGSTDENGSDT
ncbi:DUF2156 domain-containing protein [Propionibacterium freudenreichii]|uniref:bifunctional lysylphosphatidylglycerol flippase/synthetase MprF n=2 Tax=Propionibacterium freudenreichii TaxID=1744 RepID=UPI0021A73D19|nr:DUF2156 domain-containing protein [Propionibacterium freudenreichii]MDK9610276.1 DUF2156 domain-containing protein [Propionibacterium freudenreichii]